MNVKLKVIEWSDMFSYGKGNILDLTKNPITQVNAINGTGKTAIVLIIQELLTSKNMKGIKKGDIVNRYGSTDSWSGSLTFSIDENEYKVSVTRKGDTSKVLLLLNGNNISEHKIPDTYKLILSLLGTSIDVFNQLIYQSSNSQLEFLKATDTNRKKFLVSLFNLEKYLQNGEILKGKLVEQEKKLATLQGEAKAVQDFLNQTEIPLVKALKKEVPTVSDKLKEEIRVLEIAIFNYNSLCSDIDKNNLLKQEISEIKFDMELSDIDQSTLNDIKTKLSYVQSMYNSQLLQKGTHEKTLKSLNTATHCYVCKQPIDNTHTISMVDDLTKTIESITIHLNGYQNDIVYHKREIEILETERTKFLQNQRKIERFEQLSNLINKNILSTYPNNTADKLELSNKKLELEKQIAEQTDAIKFNNNVDITNAKLDTIINQKREFLARQELISSDIINLQLKIDRLTTLRKAFSPTGIVAFKLENIIKEFENEINEYLVELSDGQFQIQFRLEGEKLNIIVFSSGTESPIENTSEGEFSRIQTATLLAIRKLLSKIGGVQINFLFLDEVMGVLDASGKERLIEILQNEENTNAFIVAHDFSHPLVPQLNIIKEKNIARIV